MKTVSLLSAQKLISLPWFGGFVVNFILFLMHTRYQVYKGVEKEAWSWFLPTMIPSISIILGTIIYDVVKKPANKTRVDKFSLWLTFGFSLLYLVVLLITIASAANFAGTGTQPLAFLQSSSIYLNPLQGLVGLTLGAFYVSRK